MNEAQWRKNADPTKMLEHLRTCTSLTTRRRGTRKLRLFACACARRSWDLIQSNEGREALVTAERYADGLARRSDLTSAFSALRRRTKPWKDWLDGIGFLTTDPSAFQAAASLIIFSTWPIKERARNVANEAGLTGRAGMKAVLGAYWGHRRWLCDVFRDIWGNPFRNVQLARAWLAWNNGAVSRIARQIYDERRFESLPILADALEDAGCANQDILSHCRSSVEHVRGCWVVDLLLGKN